ncbi:AAA family ATPase [Bizionia hallyeonensis]|uniref:AAA family ATPase n=1 Tax=Bizionia hallyeonensis TaxID=1123757 RepID=A0ABW0C3P3_9FLAO
MLFNQVTKDHILQAIKDFEDKGFPNEFGPSSTYDLVYEGKKYPPKAIMAYANYYAEGRELENYFSGGIGTDCFKAIEKNGFEIILKPDKNKNLKKEFIKWLHANTKDGSNRVSSYSKALDLLNTILDYNLYETEDLKHLNSLYKELKREQRTIGGKYYVEKSPSYGTNGFYSASVKKYIQFLEQRSEDLFSSPTEAILQNLIEQYKSALINDDWLNDELYKFEWANWLFSHIDFDKQSNEEILENCLASQKENYTESKGVQFIKQGAREKLSKYIGIEDVQIFRDFHSGMELEELDCSNRNMSFPILSCWMSSLIPDFVFPASKTAFSELARTLFNASLSNSNMDFVIGMQDPMTKISEELLKQQDILNILVKKLNKKELIQLDLNWLTQDFLLFLDRNQNLLIPNPENNYQKTMISKQPTNKILYGPPGTGKTFFLKDQLFEKYISKETSITKAQHFETVVSDCSWWQVIAVALLDLKKAKVSEIFKHEWVQKKASLSNSKTIRPTLWGQLQSHTVNECQFVNVTSRQQPLIFNKTEDSYWEILEDEVNELVPELFDLRNSVHNYNPDPDKIIKHYDFVTFHQSFAYEDFIEGIKPIIPQLDTEIEESKDLGYNIEDGVFKNLCRKAENDPDNRYAIFIDEINRGNVSAIFGELITLIEIDKRKGAKNEMFIKLPYSKKEFSVPSNLDIYGTMNTADRSVEALDTALRRRFEFQEMMPDYTVIEEETVEGLDLPEVLQTINQRIELLIDRDHTIGHSYFVNVNTTQKLANAFNNKIVPLLQEYFYGDYGKIGLVLGKGFVEKLKNDKVDFAKFDYDNANDFKIPSYKLNQVYADTVLEAIVELLGVKETD